MNQIDPIRIVCASNDHFVVMLAALIKSIEKNNRNHRDILVYVIDDRIHPRNKEKLEKSIKQPSIKIEWIPLTAKLLSNIRFPNDHSSYPKNIYARLVIDNFLPDTVKRVIYMDSDMLLNSDISNLWEIDLDGKVIGAVQEPNVKTMDCPWNSGVKNYAELNIPAKAKYFNSGLMLIDLVEWRAEKVGQRVVECVEKNKKYAIQPDQYGLNVVLWNKWKELDSGWNHYANVAVEYLPHNIHFVFRKPIYTSYNGLAAYRQLFYNHLNETKFENFKPFGEFRRKLVKVNNILEKVFLF
jgi:lipopolysaccharide biosynthesis glycosyltransferase